MYKRFRQQLRNHLSNYQRSRERDYLLNVSEMILPFLHMHNTHIFFLITLEDILVSNMSENKTYINYHHNDTHIYTHIHTHTHT